MTTNDPVNSHTMKYFSDCVLSVQNTFCRMSIFFFFALFSLYKTMSSENFMIHGYSCLTSFVYLSIINANNILYPRNIFTILFPLTLGMSKLNIVIVKHNSGKYPPTIMCVGGGDQMNQVEHLSPR